MHMLLRGRGGGRGSGGDFSKPLTEALDHASKTLTEALNEVGSFVSNLAGVPDLGEDLSGVPGEVEIEREAQETSNIPSPSSPPVLHPQASLHPTPLHPPSLSWGSKSRAATETVAQEDTGSATEPATNGAGAISQEAVNVRLPPASIRATVTS